jgi:hypothetical protein
MRQDRQGGSIALYNEDEDCVPRWRVPGCSAPSQHIARKDAERQMALHCLPHGYEIVSQEKVDTGNAVIVYYGYGVTGSQKIFVTQLTYLCTSSAPEETAALNAWRK